MFGVDIDSINDKDNLSVELQNACEGFFECIPILQTALPIYKVISTPAYKKFNKHRDKLIEIGGFYSSKYLTDIKTRAAKSPEKGISLLQQWLTESNMSQDEAVSHSINFLPAGLDTVSYTAFL